MWHKVHAKMRLREADLRPYITELIKREPLRDVTLLKYNLLSLEETLARRVGMRLSGAGYDVEYLGPQLSADPDYAIAGRTGYRLLFGQGRTHATFDLLCLQVPPAWKVLRREPPVEQFELTGYRDERIVIPAKRMLFWKMPEKTLERRVPQYREPLSPTWVEGHSSFSDEHCPLLHILNRFGYATSVERESAR